MDNAHVYALVTGASRGIGLSVSQALLRSGARVIGTARSSAFPDGLVSHERFEGLYVDLADRAQMEERLRPLFGRKEPPRVLVNNAGINEAAPMDQDDGSWLDNWRHTMHVNLESPALLSKWALACWKDGEGSLRSASSEDAQPVRGLLVNISSRAAYRGDTQEYASYAASKGGLVAFTKSVARDFGRHGISAYSIAPGFIDTDMAEEAVETYGRDYLTRGMAFDRITSPEEVGELVAFLASGRVPHMTGATFHINGGSYMN
ncbi:MAG: SDR family oxidoreductase [Balneolaceae bacterium]|nr:SDR family oxidoreductase [Balneolaceae bacterium]